MNVQVRNVEVRKALESVRDTTTNPEVRRVMERALELYKEQPDSQAVGPGLSSAATVLLDEMARTKRLERQLLWLGPATILVMTAILFAVAGRFLKII